MAVQKKSFFLYSRRDGNEEAEQKAEKKEYIEWERASGKMKMLKQIYYDIKELNC